MNIRNAQPSDAAKVTELMAQLGYALSQDLVRDKITFFASSQVDEAYVAEKEGAVVGLITCHITSLFHQAGASGRITCLVIDEIARNSGVAKALVQQAESFFRARDCIKFEVTSGDHRISAHEFYKSCGYREDERRFIKQGD